MQICFERLIEGIKQKQSQKNRKMPQSIHQTRLDDDPIFYFHFYSLRNFKLSYVVCVCDTLSLLFLAARHLRSKSHLSKLCPSVPTRELGKLIFHPFHPTRPHAGRTSNVQNTFWYYDTAMCLSKSFRASSPSCQTWATRESPRDGEVFLCFFSSLLRPPAPSTRTCHTSELVSLTWKLHSNYINWLPNEMWRMKFDSSFMFGELNTTIFFRFSSSCCISARTSSNWGCLGWCMAKNKWASLCHTELFLTSTLMIMLMLIEALLRPLFWHLESNEWL